MPGCSIGRNIQKHKGSGASTLQDALENGNVATTSIQTSGHFIGDGSLLTGVNISGGSIGNLQGVTDNSATSSNKITLTNTNESLETSGNINVGNNKFYLGDGGLLSNTASTSTFQQVTNQGNVSTNTISFTNPAESITTTGNVIVGTNVHATDFVGAGAGLTSLNADNINDGGLAIARGGTGVTTGITVLDPANLSAAVSISKGGTGQTSASAAATALGLGTGDSPQFTGISLGSTAITESSGTVSIGGSAIRTGDVALGTQTSGNYVKTVTAGDGLDMTGSSGEGSDHTLSLNLKANHGLDIDGTELKIDLKTDGGLEFDSGQMRVKLDDDSINGTLPVGKGGTGLNSGFTRGDVLFVNNSGTFSRLPADSGKYLKSRGNGLDPIWASVTEEAPATAGSLTAGDGLTSNNGNFNGSTNTGFSIDLLTGGGLVFDGTGTNTKKLKVDLAGAYITGEVDTSHGGTGATAVTGTGGNNVLSVSPELTGTTSVVNISASGNIVGVIAGSNTISGTTITAGTKLVGDVNEANTSKNVFGKYISASTASGSKLTGQLNEASTNNVVYGHTITAGTGGFSGKGTDITNLHADNIDNGTLDTAYGGTGATDITGTAGNNVLSESPTLTGTTLVTNLTASGNIVGVIAGSNTISGDTITATSKFKGDVNESGTTNVVYGSTITAGTGGFSGNGSSITNLDAEKITTGVLDVDHGGTNKNSYTKGSVLYASDTDTIGELETSNKSGQYLKVNSAADGLEWSTVSATISIGNNNDNTSSNLLFTTNNTDLKRDTDGGIKYNPYSNTLSIFDAYGSSKELSASGWSGSAASATTAGTLTNSRKIGNVNFNGSSDITPEEIQMSDSSANTDFLIPFSSVTDNTTSNIKLHSDMSVLTYNPSTGSLSATKFVGNGSSLTDVIASTVTEEGTTKITLSQKTSTFFASSSGYKNLSEI